MQSVVSCIRRLRGARCLEHRASPALSLLCFTLILSAWIPTAYAFFGPHDANDKGIFNIGPGQGHVSRSSDEALKKDVLRFNYAVPKRSVIGVWTKGFSSELKPDVVDAIKVGVNVPAAEQLNQISVRIEIKGKKITQNIPMRLLHTGWNYANESINWEIIGDIDEVVFVVRPLWGSGDSTEGMLYLDFDFYKLTFLQKNSVFVKFGLVFILGLLIALAAAFVRKLLGQKPYLSRPETSSNGSSALIPSAGLSLSWLKLDLLYAVVALLIAWVALSIYSFGKVSPLDAGFGFDFLTIGLIGAVIAQSLKYALTGKHLKPSEVLQNILITGLIAAASSRQQLLQPPSNWTQLLLLNNIIAVILFLIYHGSNAYSLATSGKHLKASNAAFIVVTPYLLNWLMLLQNTNLLQTLGGALTAGVLANRRAFLEVIGRIIIIFFFNESVINAIGLASSGKAVKAYRAHIFIFLVALDAVTSPLVANLGSSAIVAALPALIRYLVVVMTTMFSHAGLWMEVYLITGVILDATQHVIPSSKTISSHVTTGMRKGMAYSAIFMTILYALKALLGANASKVIMAEGPIAVGIISGALIFPFIKTIVETFDGSQPFFERARYSYRDGSLYVRGAIAGFGFAYMISHLLYQRGMQERIGFGLIIGLFASVGVSVLRDAAYAMANRGRIQSWRLYLTDALLGSFVGSALAFYMDASQVPVVVEKFKLYTSSGFSAVDYITYPLVSKWGRMDLGKYTGGVNLLFIEALAGVINWSIAAWLFAINRVFMEAFFQKDKSPIRFFFSSSGFVELMKHMLYVLRWGLWMSPIIFTFLRMDPNPTWYNQDGGIRTLFATYHKFTMSAEAFRDWSLNIFTYVLAFDFFRILIWMDHMGLRVATLVNLSFIGLDKLDERIARFIGPASAQRYIPEAVKRFTTWGPLLIPFYLPRGKEWDYAWGTSEAMQNTSNSGGVIQALSSLTVAQLLLFILLAIIICTGISFAIRSLHHRSSRNRNRIYELGNRKYTVILKENGETYSQVVQNGHDISRRSYDTIDPCGRVLYILDAAEPPQGKTRAWPILGNFPKDTFEASEISRSENALKVVNATRGIKTTLEIHLPGQDTTAEIWTVTIENTTDRPRQLKVIPYLEWVLNRAIDDRFHTQYARLFPEMGYASERNCVLAWQKNTKAMGILASDVAPEGFLTSRVDFIGRARSIWAPRVLETLGFSDATNTAAYPTFDPIGSLLINAALEPRSHKTINIMVGYAKNKDEAFDLISKHIKLEPSAKVAPSKETAKRSPLIGHGEILPGTPQPYHSFTDNGARLLVHTPFTPRPFDHAMSNNIGHSVIVTNRGLHTSCNGNSQQNRLTPDWPDTVTKEVPAEAIYLYDPDSREWYSPTYHPLNDNSAKNESEFGVDGTAVFRMAKGNISTELTVFVPPDDPTGIYLLSVKNNSDRPRRLRIAPYFEMVLAFHPEQSGQLTLHRDNSLGALLFENPRNTFRFGTAFVSMTERAQAMETRRGRFFGIERGVSHPFMVENGSPDVTARADDRTVAAFLATLEIPAHEQRAIAIILGQTDERKLALKLIRKYKDIETVLNSLADTRKWWLSLMATVTIKTNKAEFDQLQNWLKYQTLAERIWARRGFYQTSGAFGFRDQLQDAINMIWVDPSLARKQIILHASHQFIEGDVFHWFFTLTDGRTAFACRSHASDNPLWLAWGVIEYIRMSGDDSILDEMTSYVVSEFPFAPLPKNKQGWGHLYHRCAIADSVYKHCLKSIDLVLDKRMGKHGLPLIQTGDWNDGLDEIGSEGRGESVWLGFFLYYVLNEMAAIIEMKEGKVRKEHYLKKMDQLKLAIESTWREDRYLRAIHDDGTEIGVKDSGIWEIDALTAAWAIMSGVNLERGLQVFHTALRILERDNLILLGWPALRENTTPYLGRSCKYPEGVRENGMYCHGVQWLVMASRILSEHFEKQGDRAKADEYRQIAYRLWLKIAPIPHTAQKEIEIYGGQPNKQPADMLTNFDQGRMIWNGYTGAAGWMLREALEGVIGARLKNNELILPDDLEKSRGELRVSEISRDVRKSPLNG